MPARETLLVVDTETTGIDRELCGLVQLSAVLVQTWSNAEPTMQTLLSTRCRPSVPISEEAQKVHGLSEADLVLATPDRFAAYFLHMLLQTLPEDTIIGSHNGERFDVPILDRLCPGLNLKDRPHIDTFIMSRRWYPTADSHKLEELYPMVIGKAATGAHDAAVDCYMVGEMVLHHLADGHAITLAHMAEQCATPQVPEVMCFGKHKGKGKDDVPIGYIRYIRDNFDDIDKDTQALVEYRMGVNRA